MVAKVNFEEKKKKPVLVQEPITFTTKDPEDDSKDVINHVFVVERIRRKVPREFLEDFVNFFAMISSVLSAIGCLTCAMFLAKALFERYTGSGVEKGTLLLEKYDWTASILVVLASYSITSYSFLLILIKGISMRISKLVLVYFVFGVLSVVFDLTFMIAANCHTGLELSAVVLNLTLVGLYCVFIFMVWLIYETYEIMELREIDARKNEAKTVPVNLISTRVPAPAPAQKAAETV